MTLELIKKKDKAIRELVRRNYELTKEIKRLQKEDEEREELVWWRFQDRMDTEGKELCHAKLI